jgi:hypothetical protein
VAGFDPATELTLKESGKVCLYRVVGLFDLINLANVFMSKGFITRKGSDFAMWIFIIIIHRYGYHTTVKGRGLIRKIQAGLNAQRYSNNPATSSGSNVISPVTQQDFDQLFSLPSPYGNKGLNYDNYRTTAADRIHTKRASKTDQNYI